MANNGGNVIRVFVHTGGESSPAWDPSGYSTETDTSTLVSQLGSLLDYAKTKSVFVIPVLWNLAYQPTQNAVNLFWDDSKLKSYLNNTLTPLVTGLKLKPALAAIDIINEPAGSIYPGRNPPGNTNPCFDTTNLSGTGANWVGLWLPVERVQKLINWSCAAIKAVSTNILCTIGEWSEITTTNSNTACTQCRNYYSDQCLVAAGTNTSGKLGKF